MAPAAGIPTGVKRRTGRWMDFRQRLEQAWARSGSLLCVGLDPDLARLPVVLLREADPVFAFNRAIIEATADFACAYKPQNAYYVGIGAERALERTIDYLRARYPDKCIVLDAKRSDIGATARLYAREAFDRYDADAVTVSPYLGTDGVAPFTERRDRGCFVLCRTSNPGSDRIQAATTPPLYLQVADLAAREWNALGNVGLVVGATSAEAIGEVRARARGLPLLVPGVGAQGGDLASTVRSGVTQAGGLLINSSRAILYASAGADFADAARREAMRMHVEITALRRDHT
jgi:orotidine-5'-phosphate decarboxylase